MLLLREWYMHPNGQLPAYEWAFGDVNPPVHAWAAWRVYKIEKKRRGTGDRAFLERVFHKLLLNFTWWVNRKDAEGKNIFQGGFLGLDNIGVFDRSAPLPTGGHLEQSDGTSWMAMYSLNMLAIALELAARRPGLRGRRQQVLGALPLHRPRDEQPRQRRHRRCGTRRTASSTTCCTCPTASAIPLKVRSMVGLIPLFAVETLEPELLDRLPGFKRRLEWFIENRPDLTGNVACMRTPGTGERRLLSIVDARPAARASCSVMLDETRVPLAATASARSRASTRDHPYVLQRRRPRTSRRLRAGRVDHRAVRRQLELARPDLVPGELPADRVAAEVPPLLRRRLQGRVPDRLGPDADAVGGRGGAVAPAVAHLPARRATAAGRCFGDRDEVPARSALARPGARSTSTSTATTAPASAPAIRPAGPALVAKLLQQSGEAQAAEARGPGAPQPRQVSRNHHVRTEEPCHVHSAGSKCAPRREACVGPR